MEPYAQCQYNTKKKKKPTLFDSFDKTH